MDEENENDDGGGLVEESLTWIHFNSWMKDVLIPHMKANDGKCFVKSSGELPVWEIDGPEGKT